MRDAEGRIVHITPATIRDDIPKASPEAKCGKDGCPAPDFEQSFGLAGGGHGPYEYCTVCHRVVSKVDCQDSNEEPNHAE
jgi:hypothetical protein